MIHFNRRNQCWVVVTAMFLWGCTSDAVLLPADYNASQVSHVHVKVGVETGTVVHSLTGVQGGPVPMVTGDVDLSALYAEAGVSMVRVPGGYLCGTALGSIFSDSNASVNDPESYAFDALDNVVQGMFNDTYTPKTVLYQAHGNVGGDCTVDGNGQIQGKRPEDIQQWSAVVNNVLRHLNGGLLSSSNPLDQPFISTALATEVRAVEFITDPLNRGGYSNVDDVVSDFAIWASTVKGAFPNKGDVPVMTVVSPSMPVESKAGLSGHPIQLFVDGLVAMNQAQDLDALAFSYVGDEPVEASEIASQLREMLNGHGLQRVALWAVGYQPAGALQSVDTGSAALWSARAGALSNAFGTVWQGVVDAAVYDRGDRRPLCEGTAGCDVTQVQESALWSGEGTWRPAGVAWIPWRYLDGHTEVESTASSDDPNNPIWVTSVSDRTQCVDASATGCGRVHVLIMQPGIDDSPSATSILLKISGLERLAGDAGQVRVDRLSINSSTTGPSLTDSRVFTVVDDAIVWPLASTNPSTEFLTLEKDGP